MKTCRLTSIRLGLSRSTLIDLTFPSKIETNASTRTEVNSDRTDSNFNFIFSLFATWQVTISKKMLLKVYQIENAILMTLVWTVENDRNASN